MKFSFVITLTFLSYAILFAQNAEDLHYSLLDQAFKESALKPQTDYLINEFEQFLFIYPNFAQEDEILFRLSNLYGLNQQNPQQLKTLIKLSILHGNSPLVKRSLEIIDSMAIYVPELSLSEKNEQAIRQLGNLPHQNDYKLAYLDFISFLYSAQIQKLDKLLLMEIDEYKRLFFLENKDMDAVVFWQAEINNRGKKYYTAALNFNMVLSLYKQSHFIPRALFELARLNINNLDDVNKGRDYLIELINQFPNATVTGDAQFELAKLYEINYKDLEEALTNYKLHVSAFPDNKNHCSALQRIAIISEQQGNFQESLSSYMKIVEDNSDDNSISGALKNITRLYLKHFNDPASAAKTLILYSQTFPQSDEASKNLFLAGKLYLEELKNISKANEVFELLLKKYPQSAEAEEVKKIRN